MGAMQIFKLAESAEEKLCAEGGQKTPATAKFRLTGDYRETER